jgi:hypothetical protein
MYKNNDKTMYYTKKTTLYPHFLPLLAVALVISFLSFLMYATYSKIDFPNIKNYSPIVKNFNRQAAAVITADEIKSSLSEDTSSDAEAVTPEKDEVAAAVKVVIPEQKFQYIMITDSCNYLYEGKECVEAYAEPRPGVPPVARFREGIVLRIESEITYDGITWYKVTFKNQTLHHPERLINDWYVLKSDVEIFYEKGEQTIIKNGVTSTEKRIVVDLSEQMMYAYNGDELFMQTSVSTGLELSATPLGEHIVFKKMPSRYMQGPSAQVNIFYDLPGVPWNLYFTDDGSVIHGAYWHNKFGTPYSQGCVNLSVAEAKKLYDWTPLGTKVFVQE